MLRNTYRSWGAVAKAFHWGIAALILVQFPLGWLAVSWRLSPTKLYLFTSHKSMGILILSLAGVRLLWRLANPVPLLPPGMARWERLAAHADHLALYLFMVALPITGWIIDSASNIPFRVFWLFRLPRLVGPSKSVEALFQSVHSVLAVALLVVLAVHIAAAFWHHYLRRDEVLVRMLPARRSGR